MTVYLVTDAADTAPGLETHDRYVQLLTHALGDTGRVPLVLHSDTRRGISDALAELMLYSGRAQPTLARHLRAPQRNECGRIAVALRESRRPLMVFGAERVHHLDVNVFINVARAADIDLWFVPETRCRPATRAAFDQADLTEVGLRDALADALASPTHRARRTPAACEGALALGSGTHPACDQHPDAGACVTACFADALIAARISPTAVRARLHELTTRLAGEARWRIYGAARDPYLFVERAIDQLDLSTAEKNALRLDDLALDGSVLTAPHRVVSVPAAYRPVLRLHRDVRIADGSPARSPLLIPHDDRHRRRWAATPNHQPVLV